MALTKILRELKYDVVEGTRKKFKAPGIGGCIPVLWIQIRVH